MMHLASGQTVIRHSIAIPGALAIVILVALSRVPPFDVLDNAITEHVQAGGFVQVKRDVRWNRPDCIGFTADVQIRDNRIPPRDHVIPKLRYGNLYPQRYFDTQWQVEYGQPWGINTFRNELNFSCFPFYGLWPVRLRLPDLQFHVSPPAEGR